MTRGELLDRLRRLKKWPRDAEVQHERADKALIEFINDAEIAAAYEAIPKWYA